MKRHARPLTYYEFRQRVRRFHSDRLVDLCARRSSQIPLGESSPQPGKHQHHSFAIAAVAREALAFGNTHRSAIASERDLLQLQLDYIHVEDPFLADRDVLSFLVRTGFDQFVYQDPHFHNLARVRALYIEAASQTPEAQIDSGLWEDCLGCQPETLVELVIFLYGVLRSGTGTFSIEALARPEFDFLDNGFGRRLTERVIRRQFCSSHQEFKSWAKKIDKDNRNNRKHAFNPLLAAPCILRDDSTLTAPVLNLVPLQASATSLYHRARMRHGSKFTNAAGYAFENYVGNLLRNALSHPIAHDRKLKDGTKAVDYIVTLPNLVLLVEAKATPLTESGRLTRDGLARELERTPKHALRQITRTAERIIARDPEFTDIPKDRPFLGIAVLLNDYFGAASAMVRPTAPQPVEQYLLNIAELEALTALDEPSLEFALERLVEDPSGYSELAKILRASAARNPVLERSWTAMPRRVLPKLW